MDWRTRKIFLFLLLLVVAGLAVLAAALLYLEPKLKDGIAAAISEQTGRPVQLSSFGWSLFPLRLEGEGLEIGPRPREGRPLATLGRFSLEADWTGLLSKPPQIESLLVKDLQVWIAEGGETPFDAEPALSSESRVPAVRIGRVVAENARIEMTALKAERPVRVFEIEQLVLDSLDLRKPVKYGARLRIHHPPGDLSVEGSFGPVPPERPGLTPYSGTYDFEEADLSVFEGFSGRLTAGGDFRGSVEETEVTGEASIPDFSMAGSGNPIPLQCRYEATVRDRGESIALREAEIEFRRSLLTASGEISKVHGREGSRVSVHVASRQARAQDLLELAVSSDQPPLTGAIDLDADIDMPPGAGRVMERMTARGEFHIREGRFSNLDIQATLEKISRIGGGESEAESGGSVVSNLRGTFLLENARVDFSRLQFEIPGMRLDLTGDYYLEGDRLDFSGTVGLERSPSELAPQEVSKWVRIIDPLLRGQRSGAVLPIKITGTRSRPRFRVDWGKLRPGNG